MSEIDLNRPSQRLSVVRSKRNRANFDQILSRNEGRPRSISVVFGRFWSFLVVFGRFWSFSARFLVVFRSPPQSDLVESRSNSAQLLVDFRSIFGRSASPYFPSRSNIGHPRARLCRAAQFRRGGGGGGFVGAGPLQTLEAGAVWRQMSCFPPFRDSSEEP